MRLFLAFLLLAVTAEAQQLGQNGIIFNPPGGGASSSLVPGTTTFATGTDCLAYSDAGGILRCANTEAAYFNAGAGNALFTLRKTMSGASATNNFFNLTATFTDTTSAANNAFNLRLTGAGSSAFAQNVLNINLLAGYTGAANTVAVATNNASAGTGTGNPNIGVAAQTTGAGAVGVGAYMAAVGTVTNSGYGGAGLVQTNGSPQVGLLGYSGGSGTVTHGYGLMGMITDGFVGDFNTTVVPFILSRSAIGASNSTTTYDLFRLNDNTTGVYRIIDSGAIWSSQGAKALTDATPTAFVRVAVTSNGRQGGIVDYCVDANDATNYQTRCGNVSFAFVNEGGTEACAGIGTPADADGTPTGTLTVAFTGASNAADTCDLLANAASSLTETTLRINYTVRLFGNAATTVTPQ